MTSLLQWMCSSPNSVLGTYPLWSWPEEQAEPSPDPQPLPLLKVPQGWSEARIPWGLSGGWGACRSAVEGPLPLAQLASSSPAPWEPRLPQLRGTPGCLEENLCVVSSLPCVSDDCVCHLPCLAMILAGKAYYDGVAKIGEIASGSPVSTELGELTVRYIYTQLERGSRAFVVRALMRTYKVARIQNGKEG